MKFAQMKKVTVVALAMLVVVSAARESQAVLIPISLTPDAANSTASAFGGSIANTVNDPFAYNPNSPISPLPVQSYSGAAGFHGNAASNVDVFLSYNFTNGPLTHNGPSQSFFVDLYGRSDTCCGDRDNNIDIQVYSGGVLGTLLGTVTGIAIPGSPFFVRANLAPVLTTGVTFNAIRLVAHDSEAAAGNLFTLMEIRAAQVAIPEPATASLALLGLGGLMLRRRRMA